MLLHLLDVTKENATLIFVIIRTIRGQSGYLCVKNAREMQGRIT